MESHPSVNPATPGAGKLPLPASDKIQSTSWSLLYQVFTVGPYMASDGLPYAGISSQLMPHASCIMLAEPQPVIGS